MYRKKRQFDQFGIEILGTKNLAADVEIIWIMGETLEALGIPRSSIIARVSNIQILLQLFNDSKVVCPDDIKIKEAMDEMAECRAKGKDDCIKQYEAKFWTIVNKYDLTDTTRRAWKAMLHHDTETVDDSLRSKFPSVYQVLFDELELIASSLNQHNLHVIVDLCVVRSHEYYTHFSFEIDVAINDKLYLEIAGGGRYNKLVGHFVNGNSSLNVIPSTGYAFGMQRLISMLDDIGIFLNPKGRYIQPQKLVPLTSATAGSVLIPNNTRINEVEAYLDAQMWLSQKRKQSSDMENVDIYVGDKTCNTKQDQIQLYQKMRNISKVVMIP